MASTVGDRSASVERSGVFGREDFDLVDLGILHEQPVGAVHQLRRDLAVEGAWASTGKRTETAGIAVGENPVGRTAAVENSGRNSTGSGSHSVTGPLFASTDARPQVISAYPR